LFGGVTEIASTLAIPSRHVMNRVIDYTRRRSYAI
jgi:hypothetical protein